MGNDIISGGAGNDFIYGGAGINQLWGDSATDPTVMGYNMLDNSEGKQGYVDCGPADTMNIFFPNGGEDPSNVIHCGMTVKPTQ
jgi:Ca2+-binding RTX toxin-like protein